MQGTAAETASARSAERHSDLIIDVGMHDGGDTARFLEEGFRVVAVEANPHLVEEGSARFAEPIRSGQLVIVGAAIGVLVLTSLFRGVRRRLQAASQVVRADTDPPGSVVTGTSSAQHPTEAPDDLADARRWADDA